MKVCAHIYFLFNSYNTCIIEVVAQFETHVQLYELSK